VIVTLLALIVTDPEKLHASYEPDVVMVSGQLCSVTPLGTPVLSGPGHAELVEDGTDDEDEGGGAGAVEVTAAGDVLEAPVVGAADVDAAVVEDGAGALVGAVELG
jgi:hypothetical protein